MASRRTFPFAAPKTVGNHRLSLESISKNTTSWSSNSFSRVSTSFFVWSNDLVGTGCPGMGMERLRPVAFCNSCQRRFPFRYTRTHNTRKYLLESVGCACRFRFTPVQTVFELKQRLADRVGERDARGVYECDRSDTPALSL
jgi:hypothetical protein